jgi:subtilisin family serine protease
VRAGDALALLPQAGSAVDWGAVRVAHLDTGYTEHEAFGPWTADGHNAINLVDEGRDFLQPSRPTARDPLVQVPWQSPGHGTMSGSVLSAVSASLTGVAPGLPLVPFRVTNSSIIDGRVARAIGRAINHVVRNDVAAVVNISLGFPIVPDRVMGRAIDRAYEAGVIVVGAAGQEVDKVVYPAKHRRTIAAAGIRKRGSRFSIYARYDRYGRIDTWAPAQPIRRATATSKTSYETGDGTTYAAIHTSAAAALWLRFHGPEIGHRYGQTWRRVEAFRHVLLTPKTLLPFKSPPDNEAGPLDLRDLLRRPLPDPDVLRKEIDLAGDDVA